MHHKRNQKSTLTKNVVSIGCLYKNVRTWMYSQEQEYMLSVVPPTPPGQNSQRSGYSDINKPSEAAEPQASLSKEKLFFSKKRQSHSTAKKQLSLKKSTKRVSKQKLYSKKKQQ